VNNEEKDEAEWRFAISASFLFDERSFVKSKFSMNTKRSAFGAQNLFNPNLVLALILKKV
jgi:hypothetical protein